MLISWIWGEVVGAHVKGGSRAREWRQGKDATARFDADHFYVITGWDLNDDQSGDRRAEHNDTGLSGRLVLINSPPIVLGLYISTIAYGTGKIA